MSDQGVYGMCTAFGCPLFGTVKTGTTGEGDWYCPCHFNRQPSENDAITAKLNAHRFIANAIRDIRTFYGTVDWTDAYRGVKKLLVEGERRDLLMGEHDHGSVRAWLSRLEKTLMDLTREVGRQARITAPRPAAGVIGPTHAAEYFGEVA